MNSYWLWTIRISLILLSFGSVELSWSAIGSGQITKAFTNQEFGTPRLGKSPHFRGAKVPSDVEKAWEELKSRKGAEEGLAVFSTQTGLPHSISYLKLPLEGGGIEEKARNFLDEQNVLFLKGEGLSNLRIQEGRKDSFTGAGHVDFIQYYKGLRVYGSGFTVHFDADENLIMVNGDFIPNLTPANGEPGGGELTAQETLSKALKRLPPFALAPLGEGELAVYSQAPAQGGVHLAYRFELMGAGADGHRVLFADAYTGEVLAFFPTVWYIDGTATVFAQHAREPNTVQRTITDLDGTGFLRGPLLTVADEENPQVHSPSHTYNFSPNSQEFRQPTVYYYLTETRKRLRQYGFDDFAVGAIPAHVNVLDKVSGEFNNAFFNPSGNGFVFGNGDGIRTDNMARDFDIAAHEFGHFFDNHLKNPNSQSTPLHTPIRAWGEACGDTIAAIINGDPNIAESVIPGEPTMRNINNTKRFPNDLENEEHVDGEIFGGANWDFMKLVGNGNVTLAAREEMAKVLMAGIPFIPVSNVQFRDILIAFIQGDNTRGGNNVARLRNAYGMHGITEQGGIQKADDEAEAPPTPIDEKQAVQFQELHSGIPVAGSLSNGGFHDFYIRVPSGATSLTVQTFVPFGFPVGDIELRVAPSNYANLNEVRFAYTPFSVVESVVVDNGANAFPVPLSRDTIWLIEIADNPFDFLDSQVGLVATVQGGDAELTQIFFNTPVDGAISTPQEFDRYFFQGNAGQTINLAADRRGASVLDPLLAIGNSSGQLLVFDDNSGGNGNALIRGFTLPATDNYLVLVQSTVTNVGPLTFGDYRLLLTSGTPPGPTPTPGPTPVPGGVPILSSGVPVTGTVGPTNFDLNQLGISDPFRVIVPAGARQLLIRVTESPVPSGNFILRVRKGAPLDETFAPDDFIGLGNRKSTVVVTPNSGNPLVAGEYFLHFINLAQTQQNFQLVAFVEEGQSAGNPFDSDQNGEIDARDLVSLLKGNPQQDRRLFNFARFWSRSVN